MKRLLCVLLLLVGCGSPAEPSGSTTSGSEGAPCPTELTECYDESSRADCLGVAETCAPEDLVALETCPVQYACDGPTMGMGDEAEPVGSDDAERCASHLATDACMNESNFAACREAEAECPGAVQVMESCPLQFACP